MEIEYADEFVKRFTRLPVTIKKRAIKQEKLFRENPLYPSLHTEKLKPKKREVWSFRVDRQYRIIFRYTTDNTVIFLTVGEHDWIYKYIDRL